MWLDHGYGIDLDNHTIQDILDEMTPEQAKAYWEELKKEDSESYGVCLVGNENGI